MLTAFFFCSITPLFPAANLNNGTTEENIMTSSTMPKVKFNITLPASLNEVDKVLTITMDFLKGNSICGNLFVYNYILREALNNAVLHGCHQDISKTITVNLQLSPKSLDVSIKDDGHGFDWKPLMGKQLVAPESTHGRGIYSMRKFHFEASYNDKGNILYLHKDLKSS